MGSFAKNPIYLTNDFTGADITMAIGDWDGDGLSDDEEAYVIFSNPSNSLSPIQVDDDGPNDPVPGDPETSDPFENGSRYHPYDSIQQAIDVSTGGSVILVLDGVYSGTGNKDINTKGKAVTIRSRYGYNSTTIDVASVQSGFVFSSNETAATVIKGFTIHTWASYFGRQGILCDKASPTIEDCRIWDCGVAGILCTNGANPTIRRTRIEANTGGIRCYGSSPVIDSCLIRSNYASRGAGVLIADNSSPYFVNTLIVGNQSTNDGGGLYVGAGCNPTGINCTVAFNVALNRGSAISTAGTPLFKNVIVWGNIDPANDPIDLQGSPASFTYSCVQEPHPGGNFTNNPLLVSDEYCSLQPGSPCIDAGTAVGAPSIDYSGQRRPLDGNCNGIPAVDIGAYELLHPLADSDGDGMPDGWEADNNLNVLMNDAMENPDGDANNNWEEWRAGTNPRDGQSFFRFWQTVSVMPQGVLIVWPSITGRTYAVDRSTNLTLIPAFSNIASGVQGQSGSTVHTDTTVTTSGPYIYRVKIE